jgi:hypothetical protein
VSSPEFPTSFRTDRRTAIKWMMSAAASVTLIETPLFGADDQRQTAKGYGTDPNLIKTYQPGDLWPLTFTADQRTTVTVLCDTIIPADSVSPAASEVGVPDFIDEWISAPYPGHDKDRRTVLEGLAWLNEEAERRHGNRFSNLSDPQRAALCEDICLVATAKPQFRSAALFFKRFRDLTAGGFYTTPVGMKDIGYVGNLPMATFDGPPPEVLKRLGLS